MPATRDFISWILLKSISICSRFRKEICFNAMIFLFVIIRKSSSEFDQIIKIIAEKIIQKDPINSQKIFSPRIFVKISPKLKTIIETRMRKNI